MEIVAHKGGIVQYHDPHIPTARTSDGKQFHSIELSEPTLSKADVVVLTTNHTAFDVEFIQKHAGMIVDLRNMIKEGGDQVYKL
jgi:UDP-N-acetyl-D-glucosamine dehydrogenase